MEKRLRVRPLPLQWPVLDNGLCVGTVDLITMTLQLWSDGMTVMSLCDFGDTELEDTAWAARNDMLEVIAYSSDVTTLLLIIIAY